MSSKVDDLRMPWHWRLMMWASGLGAFAWVCATGAMVLVRQIACGIGAEGAGVLVLPWTLLLGTGNGQAGGGCDLGALRGPAGLLAGVVFVGGIVLVVWVLLRRRAYRASPAARAKELRTRDGLAQKGEVVERLGAAARLKSEGRLRSSLENPKVTDIAVYIGRAHGVDVYLSVEDSVVLVGPPRMGKGLLVIINTILNWRGPLITTSTRSDNLNATYEHRARLGDVTVFDPQGLTGIRETGRVNPTIGCEDQLVAMQRAGAIMGGTKLGASASNGEWAAEAEGVLAQLLMAAGFSGQGARALRDWGAKPTAAREAVQILRVDGDIAWADSLEDTLDSDPKLLQSKWMGVSSALRPLLVPSVLASMSPEDGRGLDPDRFLQGENTLYLIGNRAGGAGSAGFLGAVLDDVVARARIRALTSPGSRLDPPLALVLDEIANLFSWKELPTVLADGGGIGIWTMAVLQALSQAETNWSKAEASTIWSAAIAKIVLGGGADTDTLADLSTLLGERERNTRSRSGSGFQDQLQLGIERLPVLSVSELSQLPFGMGVLKYRNLPGVLMDMPSWKDRDDAAETAAAIKRTEAMQLAEFQRRAAQHEETRS